ncbi:MAG TPA: thioredoxin family protein [Kofleriaceae bacterium]|nr:thioredoxin family protein [Kofleriaceae bacterium]
MTIRILDFSAPWCGPCKTLRPVLASLATEYGARVELVEIDTEADPVATVRYDVRATPTIVLERDGVVVGRVVGARPRAFIAGMLDRALDGDVAIAGP